MLFKSIGKVSSCFLSCSRLVEWGANCCVEPEMGELITKCIDLIQLNTKPAQQPTIENISLKDEELTACGKPSHHKLQDWSPAPRP